MRILFILHQFPPEFAAGTEIVTLNLAHQARRHGHEVEILTCSILDAALWEETDASGLRRTTIQDLPVQAIVEAPESKLTQYGFGRNAETERAARAFLDARPPFDLVHVTHSLRMIEAVEVVHERRLPYIVTLTDFFLDCYRVTLTRTSGELCDGPCGGRNCIAFCPLGDVQDEELLERQARTRRLLQGARAVSACSDYLAAVFKREHPDLAVGVVEHGLDLARFAAAPRSPGGELVFGYLGTISQSKGVHVLAEAFADALTPDARLELIGPCFDDELRSRLTACAQRAPNIALRGPVPATAVPELLAGLDVLCLPSLWPETFSLAIHEGFAAGLPCLVSDLGWPGRLVRLEGCGEPIPAGDVAAWRLAITRIALDRGRLEPWRLRTPRPRSLDQEGNAYEALYRPFIDPDGLGPAGAGAARPSPSTGG